MALHVDPSVDVYAVKVPALLAASSQVGAVPAGLASLVVVAPCAVRTCTVTPFEGVMKTA